MYDILFTAGDECCENLKLSLKNDAFISQGKGQSLGNYKILGRINFRNVWKLDDELNNRFLWFDPTTDAETWVIGSSIANYGPSGPIGRIFGPGSFKCPNEVGTQWKYFKLGIETIQDGGNDVSVKCQGKEQLSIR